jgi:hypothetical protein
MYSGLRDREAAVLQGFEHGKTDLGNRKLPNVISAMNGLHIPAPSKNGSRYINRKSFHSINLLGVVDHQERFTYIYVGEAGNKQIFLLIFLQIKNILHNVS